MKFHQIILSCVFVMIFIFSTVIPTLAGPKSEINKSWRGIAIKGYDPVAYHKEGKPIKGFKTFELQWKGAKWRFASAEYRDIFRVDPEKYAPK